MSSCLDDLFSYQRAQCVTSSINATGTWDNPGRSWLFVPGNRDRMIAKAASVGADVVMFDLEDSVPPEEKANALGKVSRYLATQPTSSTRGDTKPAAFVRVNRSEGEGLAAQLGPLVRGGLVGVCIPKVESPIDVATVSDMLSEFEARASLPAGSVWVQPIIETALGLLHAEQIAGCDTRVLALAFGAEDFALDMGIDRLDAVAELDQARWHVSVSARAAGVLAVDCVYPRIDDERGLIQETTRAKQMGYQGKQIIHPRQIEAVHSAFAPTRKEIENARRIVEAFEAARLEGKGTTALDGRMIDEPVAERARRLLSEAERHSDATL